ncbi:inorganic diphosphatase [Streptomyces himastatinicus ATCC 53653]|uniref:inorganic diphosphatase n=1 Tax=Streptomyces himastatinicus ATCC 53653 TaxID=457427 RepID=D9W7D1_9ACTN|nr:inorganic diphosphatase [Streptomyces himastatinicus ATCC 53653]
MTGGRDGVRRRIRRRRGDPRRVPQQVRDGPRGRAHPAGPDAVHRHQIPGRIRAISTHTLGRDGDPLDALVTVGEPTFPGCVILCRAIGMYCMRDEKGPDEKILCVPAHDPRYVDVQDIDDVPEFDRMEITHFFDVYKDLEPGKSVEGSHWEGRDQAYAEIAASRARAR